MRHLYVTIIFLIAALATCSDQLSAEKLAGTRQEDSKNVGSGGDRFYKAYLLGKAYITSGDYPRAVEALRSASPKHWGIFQQSLLDAWRDLDSKCPFDPLVHLGFGEAWLKWGSIRQAQIEFRQAAYLSPQHHNSEAEAKLRYLDAVANKRVAIPIELTGTRKPEKLADEVLKKWTPQKHFGLLLTRFGVLVDSGGIATITVIGQSGSADYDRYAKSVLSSADFKRLQTPCYMDICFLSSKSERIVDAEISYNLAETSN